MTGKVDAIFDPANLDNFSAIRRVLIKDLKLEAMLGIYEHEKIYPQTIVINIEMAVPETGLELEDDHNNVVCYATAVKNIKEIVAKGHVHLVETLADMIAASCLDDERVLSVKVRLEKPDAIEEAASVGIEIERSR